MKRLPRLLGVVTPLWVQVLGLLLFSLVVAQFLSAVVIITLPPPAPALYRMSEVVRILQSGGKEAEAQGFIAHVHSGPPVAQPRRAGHLSGAFLNVMASRELARRLGVPVADVRVVDSRPASLFGPAFRFGSNHRPNHGPRRLETALGDEAEGPDAAGPPAPQIGPDAGRPPPPGPPGTHGPDLRGEHGPSFRQEWPENALLFGHFSASVRQSNGVWLTVQPHRDVMPSVWQQRVLIWLVACAVLLAPLAYWFSRRLAWPITAFAQAAERLGRNPGALGLTLSGPAEVGVAVAAFNDMQSRLSRYVDDRTRMIGAVAHDLRTPLMRMRFLLEARPEDVQGKMSREIDEMEAMIAATMAFVKDASARGEQVTLDLGSLVESLTEDMTETGAPITCDPCPQIIMRGDPIALRRLVGNLLTNAVKFAGAAEVSMRVEGGDAVLEVADRGPGLPDADLERAFEPFYRAEASRNRGTGGIGLGLAVVRSAASAHGGAAVLFNRPGGGLVCCVRLPLDAEAA